MYELKINNLLLFQFYSKTTFGAGRLHDKASLRNGTHSIGFNNKSLCFPNSRFKLPEWFPILLLGLYLFTVSSCIKQCNDIIFYSFKHSKVYFCIYIIISFKTIPCNIVKEFPNQFVSKEILQSKFVNLRIIRSLTVKYTKQQYCKHAIQYWKMLNGIK